MISAVIISLPQPQTHKSYLTHIYRKGRMYYLEKCKKYFYAVINTRLVRRCSLRHSTQKHCRSLGWTWTGGGRSGPPCCCQDSMCTVRTVRERYHYCSAIMIKFHGFLWMQPKWDGIWYQKTMPRNAHIIHWHKVIKAELIFICRGLWLRRLTAWTSIL